MSQQLQKLTSDAEKLERSLGKVKAKHVNRHGPKDAIRLIANDYFGESLGIFVARLGGETDLARLDASIQELVRLAQARTRVADYRASISEIKRASGELEIKLLKPANSVVHGQSAIASQHQRIIQSLLKISVSAANSFEQGLLDLQFLTRKSWRGTSVEFREALRETLDALAPDDLLTKQPGFKLEPNTTKPTMKQKAVSILRARRPKDPQVKSFTDAVEVVEGLIGNFVRSVYTRSSVAVHVSDSIGEVRKVRDYVTLVLAELLEIGE